MSSSGWIPDQESFGTRLAMVRQHHGWNIKKAAIECGLDPVSWLYWETRGRMPRHYQGVCMQIAEHSGCQLVWLMTGQLHATRQYHPAELALAA